MHEQELKKLLYIYRELIDASQQIYKVPESYELAAQLSLDAFDKLISVVLSGDSSGNVTFPINSLQNHDYDAVQNLLQKIENIKAEDGKTDDYNYFIAFPAHRKNGFYSPFCIIDGVSITEYDLNISLTEKTSVLLKHFLTIYKLILEVIAIFLKTSLRSIMAISLIWMKIKLIAILKSYLKMLKNIL